MDFLHLLLICWLLLSIFLIIRKLLNPNLKHEIQQQSKYRMESKAKEREERKKSDSQNIEPTGYFSKKGSLILFGLGILLTYWVIILGIYVIDYNSTNDDDEITPVCDSDHLSYDLSECEKLFERNMKAQKLLKIIQAIVHVCAFGAMFFDNVFWHKKRE